MRVMIVEDNAVSRHMLEANLARWGYETVSAADGREAWGIINSDTPPDIAIVDWLMPGLDGIDVCRLTRESDATRGVYLIMLTSLGSDRHARLAHEAGADDYLTKPMDPDVLQSRLKVGERIVGLQQEVVQKQQRITELEQRLEELDDVA